MNLIATTVRTITMIPDRADSRTPLLVAARLVAVQVPPGNHLHRVDHIVGLAGGRAQARVKQLTAEQVFLAKEWGAGRVESGGALGTLWAVCVVLIVSMCSEGVCNC